jgi:hypothetical protein
MHLLAIILLVIPIAWIYAEFKSSRGVRVGLGLLSLVVAGFVVYSISGVLQFYESGWHRTSIRDAAELLRKGDTNAVLRAFDTYNSIVATGSTFRASEKMMQSLRRDEASGHDSGDEPSGAANGSQPIRSETNRTLSAAGSRR